MGAWCPCNPQWILIHFCALQASGQRSAAYSGVRCDAQPRLKRNGAPLSSASADHRHTGAGSQGLPTDAAAFDNNVMQIPFLVLLPSTRVLVTQLAARRKSKIDIDQSLDGKSKVLQQQVAPP
jgi:hypothetical protein